MLSERSHKNAAYCILHDSIYRAIQQRQNYGHRNQSAVARGCGGRRELPQKGHEGTCDNENIPGSSLWWWSDESVHLSKLIKLHLKGQAEFNLNSLKKKKDKYGGNTSKKQCQFQKQTNGVHFLK